MNSSLPRRPARLLLVLLCIILTLLTSIPAARAYVHPISISERVHGVLRAYDAPTPNWLPGHRGVDLLAAVGAPIFAAKEGVVAFAGVVAGTPVVSIDHPDGLRTTYQPVHARVAAGEEVTQGQLIGTLGHSTDGYPGLHWGVRDGPDSYRNPLGLLKPPIIRLKPLHT
ncbi:M23 family metallopeptidase [Corynebacterium kozikiae]|uniref:M23 family metallopeptidase n=1 Tax=Corynebacterium kozikiae TaxID=2968469 RepID=UPI00211C7868|nr:M23 family metallopeptidase [Corynebacterium sp. 76QC2CO]MCQ9342378.1 M23 family metallopeptidase [Corynebacterium sp. 76QC2CO]